MTLLRGTSAVVLLAGLLASAAAADTETSAPPTRIVGGMQPQLAAAADGKVWLTFGKDHDVLVTHSDDGGRTFGAPILVQTLPKLALGMRRGPRITAMGDVVTVTVIAEELIAFHSIDAGKSWSGPININDVPSSTREGLHDLAASADGRLFVTWLDLRHEKMELWGAESTDGGKTWGANQQIYRSPDISICECCNPNALFDNEGNLAVTWRNSIGGSRDIWMSIRPRGAKEFGAAKKLGEGTWTLNACPMDGGEIVALGGGEFGAVWQRAGEVFFCPASGPELLLGKGKQPVVAMVGEGPVVFWQQGPDLVRSRPGQTQVEIRAVDARYCVVATLPKNRGAVLAYEHGSSNDQASSVLVVERL